MKANVVGSPLIVLQILDSIVDPLAAFRRVTSTTNQWWLLTIVYAVAAAALTYFGTSEAVRPLFQADHIPGSKLIFAISAAVVVAFVSFIVRVIIVSWAVWVGVIVTGNDMDWSRALEITALAQSAVVIHLCVNVLLFKILGPTANASPEIGLNLVVHGEALEYFLAPINIFSLWYVALLAIGVKAAINRPWRRVIAALIVYLMLYMIQYAMFGKLFYGKV